MGLFTKLFKWKEVPKVEPVIKPVVEPVSASVIRPAPDPEPIAYSYPESDTKVDVTSVELVFDFGLPFVPKEKEIIYLEQHFNQDLNDFIASNAKRIDATFRKRGFSFIYIPQLVEQLAKEQAFSYHNPKSSGLNAEKLKTVDSTLLHQYLTLENEPQAYLGCFVEGWKDCPADITVPGEWRMLCFPLNPENPSRLVDMIPQICKQLHDEFDVVERKKRSRNPYYDLEDRYQLSKDKWSPYVPPRYSADESFEEDANALEVELRKRLDLINDKGMVQAVLRRLLDTCTIEPSRMVITKDYRLLLPDFRNQEVDMGPLPKALYLLFLDLPDGILLKELTDYREQLISYYLKVTNRDRGDVILRSIESVLNPRNNSVNLNITRINSAFKAIMPQYLADQYCITGKGGTSKKILLDRSLVVRE